jgi:peroxiredoxin
MTETTNAAGGRKRWQSLGLLGVAVAAAAGITAYLFLSGDDGDGAPAANGFETGSPTPGTDNDLGPIDPDRPEVGKPAPDFALVDARDGTVRKLSDFRGRPVLVNWYASWCGPCRAEIPEFNAMIAALGEDGILVLGIDYQESASAALSILDELGATYPALLDSDGEVAEHYRVGNRLPSSFFVDAEGVLRAMQIGQVTEERLVEHLAAMGIEYEPAE